MMNAEVGFGRKVLDVLEDHDISFEHLPSGVDTMSVIVHTADLDEHREKVIASLNKRVRPDSIVCEDGLALLAVVGRGMKANRGTASRLFAALAMANINVRMIDQGSSELNIIIGVHNEDFDNAIRAIYDVFVKVEL